MKFWGLSEAIHNSYNAWARDNYLASAYSTLYIYRWTAMHVDVAMGRYAALEDGALEVRSETGVRSV